MSNISDRHVIEVFVSNKSKALTGQRLAVISYKITKKEKEAGLTEKSKPSMCVSIPPIAVSKVDAVVLEAFKPYVVAMIEDAQDKIIRQFADNEIGTIGDADISFDNVLAYLDAESKGERLTKDVITEWFDTGLADMLRVAFADKLGLSDTPSEDETKKLEQQINVYREKLASLAGGKTMFEPEVAAKMIKALEFATADDSMANRFKVRLTKMKETPKAAVDMMGL